MGLLGSCAGAPPAATAASSASSLRCTSRITTPEDRALALDGLAQPLELLGVGIAAGLAPQRLAFLGIGLLQAMPARLAALTTLWRAISSSRLSTGWAMALDCTVESTITRSRSAGLDGLDLDGAVDGGLEQLLDAVLAEQAPEAADLRGVARQARLVVVHAAEELPLHVLGPAFDEFFVAQVEAVLEVQQAGHQADGQARAAGRTDAAAELDVIGAQQIFTAKPLGGQRLAGQLRRHRRLDLGPGQPRGEHCQRVPQIDHLVQPGAEKIVRAHRQIPQKSAQRSIEVGDYECKNQAGKPAFMRVAGELQGRPLTQRHEVQRREASPQNLPMPKLKVQQTP